MSQQSLRIANQRKSHNSELRFSIIHKLLGIITSFPVEDKNFYVVCFLLIFGPMGITWEGGGQIGGATLILWAWAGEYKKRLQRGGKFWKKLYNLNLFVTNRFYNA